VVNGSNTYTLTTPVAVLTGQVVWLAVLTDANVAWVLQSVKSGARFNNDLLSSGFSNPFGSSSVDNKQAPVFAFFLTAANATLAPSLFVDSDQFRSPSLSESNQIMETATYVDPDFFYQPVIGGSWQVTPVGYDDTVSDAIYAPSVTPGSVTALPALVADADAFYQPSASAYDPLAPLLVADADAFYAATLTQPFQSLAPLLVTDADLIPDPVVGGLFSSLLPGLVADSDSFAAPTAAVGAPDLLASLVNSDDVVYAPTVGFSDAAAPLLVIDADAFYQPAIGSDDVVLSPSLVPGDDAFYPETEGGSYEADAALFADSETYYSPTVSPGAATISPSLYADDRDQFWQEAIGELDGAQSLGTSLVADVDAFYSPFVGGDQKLFPQLVPSDDFFFFVGNDSLKHVYQLLGSEPAARALQGSADSSVDVGGGGGQVELLGEV